MANSFSANRSQRRAWKQHANLDVTVHALQDRSEHYDLYQRYQSARHKNGGMDNDDRESYQNFLLQSNVDSLLVEFREEGVLRMVSLIDLLNDGLSSVYTFYEPDVPQACFGVYNVLWQIELCRKLNLDFVYLGYWIEKSRKMTYKTDYQPAQGLINGTWQAMNKAISGVNEGTKTA
jgi:arginine-tRNA-protein transferase